MTRGRPMASDGGGGGGGAVERGASVAKRTISSWTELWRWPRLGDPMSECVCATAERLSAAFSRGALVVL